MRDFFRLLATTIIWGAFVAVVAITMTSSTGPIADASGSTLVGIMAITAFVAAAMTFAIWNEGFDAPARRDSERLSSKRKRSESERLARLLEQLGDDKIHDLEILLRAQRAEARDADER